MGKPSHSTGENGKWYGHFGKQLGSILGSETNIYQMIQLFHSMSIYSRDMKSPVHIKIYVSLFTATLFIIAQTGKSPVSTNRGVANKL